MVEHEQIRKGMVVRSREGHTLGHVIFVEQGCFQIEKGLFFKKNYVCDFSEVDQVNEEGVVLKHGMEHLEPIAADECYREHPDHQRPHAPSYTSPPPTRTDLPSA